MDDFLIREATRDDVPVIFDLIKELALYEKAPNEVTNTMEQLTADGFGNHPLFDVLLAEADNQIVGMSFCYYRYSTWKGKCLYLEDLIVTENCRGKGIGNALFDATAKKAKQEQCKMMVWQVLDWNTPSINFYSQKGSKFSEEWINCFLNEEDLRKF